MAICALVASNTNDQCDNKCYADSIYCNEHLYMENSKTFKKKHAKNCKGNECKDIQYWQDDEKLCYSCRNGYEDIIKYFEDNDYEFKFENCTHNCKKINVGCMKHAKEKVKKDGLKICSNSRNCGRILKNNDNKKKCEPCRIRARINDNRETIRKKYDPVDNTNSETHRICSNKKCPDNGILKELKYFIKKGTTDEICKKCNICRQRQNKLDNNRRGVRKLRSADNYDKIDNLSSEQKQYLEDYVKKSETPQINILKKKFQDYVHKENKRRDSKYECKLSFSDFLTYATELCIYCGRIPGVQGITINNIFLSSKWSGIDRIDPKKSYTKENCVSCCTECNISKGILSVNQFVSQCVKIMYFLGYINTNYGVKYDKYSHKSGRFANYKLDALKKKESRNIKFNLTKDEYLMLVNNVCYLCGRKNDENNRNGIDRLDSSLSYTINNCRTCCHRCNFMKKNYTLLNFLVMCYNVVAYRYFKPIKCYGIHNLRKYIPCEYVSRTHILNHNNIYHNIINRKKMKNNYYNIKNSILR